MPGVQYHHIGHQPRFGSIALWSLDTSWRLHERCREFEPYAQPEADWLDWSHQKLFEGIPKLASGRVELAAKAGSLHVPDPDIVISDRKLRKILDVIDARYPGTRWYLFADGQNGTPVMTALTQRVVTKWAPPAMPVAGAPERLERTVDEVKTRLRPVPTVQVRSGGIPAPE